MRTIKFRAWNEKDTDPRSRMITPVILDAEGRVLMPDGDTWDIPVMQFTNLTDKNGVEIYEGDIVQVGEAYWTMKWLERTAAFAWVLGNVSMTVDNILDGEIIGNIYSNPELLSN